ncbi:gastrula zinc finger protein XlCGF8.2DB-like [Ochlerotatus camptorhynchus]|uniref:gastrula zinc finger protein XlCGF8.2DB-like n=1 Tax=Ochlerotatus camptorhynchus TaxID=644619 RepID=UPI0031D2AA84
MQTQYKSICCRLCLDSLEYTLDAVILNENEKYSKLISDVLSIEILNDSLQDYFMCFICKIFLDSFDQFKQKCLKNDVVFREQHQFCFAEDDSNVNTEVDPSEELRKIKLEIEGQEIEPENMDAMCNDLLEDKSKTQKISCTECGKMISKNNIMVHMAIHKQAKARFPCIHCDKDFTDLNNLRKHVNTHTRELIYPCDICGKIFDRTDTLGKHRKIMHSDERNQICSICGKGYALKQSLTQHLKSAHSNVKTKECQECGMMFKFSNELKMHIIKHTKERPHPCPMCPKQFTRAYYLKVHIRSIHSCES